MSFPRRVLVVAAVVLSSARLAHAQELHGTIVDSANRRPVASAVLVVIDDAGLTRGRTITNDRGQYHIALTNDARKVRALRLGFRARELAIPAGGGELNLAMVVIPALLEKVTVRAARACPRRDDSQSALALLEQARAGLLATIVAAESNPATMKLLRFERLMDGTSDHVNRQVVHIDSLAGKKKSFEAANSASDFVRNGFARDSGGSRIIYGPDAEVLLDDAFANAYCFRLVDRERDRPNQVGLGFTAAEEQRDRVDLDGALWIDTLARRLVDIEFSYEGLKLPRNAPTSRGHVHFKEMPNGMVVIDRWTLANGAARNDTTGDYIHPMIRQHFDVHENGGEIARAVWADGLEWRDSLATVRIKVVTEDGLPENRVALRLGDSDYGAIPDANGDVLIPDVLPGPYPVVVVDTSAAASGTVIGVPLQIVATRGTTFQGVVVAPPREAFLRKRCATVPTFRWITATVTREDGTPVNAAHWEAGSDFDTTWETVYSRGIAGTAGTFGFCNQTAGGAGKQLRVFEGSDSRNGVVTALVGAPDRMTVKLPAHPASTVSPH